MFIPHLGIYLCRFLQFFLQALDNFLAEMGPFCEFFFNFFMDFNFPLICLDLLLHLVVLVNQNFGLLRLVFKFSGQLMILEDGKMRGRLQLLIIHSE